MLNGVALYKKSIECVYQSIKRCFLIVNILKVRGCNVFGLWIGKNVLKSSERVLKHTLVCLFGHIIGN